MYFRIYVCILHNQYFIPLGHVSHLSHNDVTQALDQNRDVILILLDLKSAFDCLNHTIMINRLREIGISGDMLKWFESYLSGRTYSVKINQE